MAKQKNRYYLYIIAGLTAIVILYLLSGFQTSKPKAFQVNNETYNITAYAYTIQQQEQGLMNSTVTSKTFMLFAFSKLGIYPFWMKHILPA